MTNTNFLDGFAAVPGGALAVRQIAVEVERATYCGRLALRTLQRELSAPTLMPLFPGEVVSSEERGRFLLRSLSVGTASENLQAIATHPRTPSCLRRHAAHVARWWLSVFLKLCVEHQRALGTGPKYRVVSSGPLAVVWVAGGHVRWELDQFDLIGPDGDLNLLADLPAHINTQDKLARWTETHCEVEPTPPRVGDKDVCRLLHT